MVLMFDDQRTFWTLFATGLAVFALHGPVVGRPDYNGLRYLLGPWLCPAVGAAYYFFKPFNPYRVPSARMSDVAGFDAQDPDARRLVEVFQSREARNFLPRAMLKISGQLFGIMVLLTILHWHSLTWTLTSFWLGPGLLVGCFASLGLVGNELVTWGLKRWEADSRGQ
jgi:hypothetical protein